MGQIFCSGGNVEHSLPALDLYTKSVIRYPKCCAQSSGALRIAALQRTSSKAFGFIPERLGRQIGPSRML